MNANDQITVEVISNPDSDLQKKILEIDEKAFGPGSLNHWSLPLFLHYGRVYLARCNGEPAGSAQLIRDWEDPGLAYLYGLAVAEAYRNRGIGTFLLGSILETLPRSGFRRLQLTVTPENEVAIHLYQNKFHLNQLKFIENYYGPGENRWLLEWKTEEQPCES
jgi:[ribosomal protein S18]-alanine N-acetyltransferase